MIINQKKIINLPVFANYKKIGKVISFEIDTESQSILNYEVKADILIKDLLNGNFIVNRGQVMDISFKGIIVDNNFAIDQVGENNRGKKTINKEAVAISYIGRKND